MKQLPSSEGGFTLIELIIVGAIIAIIAAIALPSYQSQIQSTRRGAAAGCLLEIAQQMERQYTTSLSYNSTTTLPNPGCVADQSRNYTFAFASGSPETATYVIQAIPIPGMADENCGSLTLNQRTVKGTSSGNDPATVKQCWK
jgi:type IV pilus assembly protein PilE